VSSVTAGEESYLHTPPQLRPVDSWAPQTPAEDEEPPPYQEHVRWLPPPSACASSILEPVQLAKLFRSSGSRCGNGGKLPAYGQEGTQPAASGIPEDVDFYLDGGEEIAPYGLIPTPLRSQRRLPGHKCAETPGAIGVRHVAVQANRHSIDGHAGRPSSPPSTRQPDAKQAAGRSRLTSIIRHNGAPECEASAAVTPASARSGIRTLQYPKVAPSPLARGQAEADSGQPLGWDGRVALSQALSEAMAEDFAEQQHAWGLGTPDCNPGVERVAKFLRKTATRAERACVVEALQPWAAAEGPTGAEVADEEDHMRELEAEIAAVDERLASMRAAEADLSQIKEATPCETISRLVAQLSVLESSVASMTAAGAHEQLHECLQQLGCVDGWFQRSFDQLEEAERDLVEREYEASQRSLVQFPGEALDPQRELLRLR